MAESNNKCLTYNDFQIGDYIIHEDKHTKAQFLGVFSGTTLAHALTLQEIKISNKDAAFKLTEMIWHDMSYTKNINNLNDVYNLYRPTPKQIMERNQRLNYKLNFREHYKTQR